MYHIMTFHIFCTDSQAVTEWFRINVTLLCASIDGFHALVMRRYHTVT